MIGLISVVVEMSSWRHDTAFPVSTRSKPNKPVVDSTMATQSSQQEQGTIDQPANVCSRERYAGRWPLILVYNGDGGKSCGLMRLRLM
jgi:hypothetical protein